MAKMQTGAEVDPLERITQAMLVIRGQKVLLDSQLAQLYGVPTKVLHQAVKRDIRRFPEDFVFELSSKELEGLRPHLVPLSSSNNRSRPLAFTTHGVIQAASVLKGSHAAEMSIYVVRAICQGEAPVIHGLHDVSYGLH